MNSIETGAPLVGVRAVDQPQVRLAERGAVNDSIGSLGDLELVDVEHRCVHEADLAGMEPAHSVAG